MKFDVYGRFTLEVLRENDAWVAYNLGLGARTREDEIVIPSSLGAEEIAEYLDDLFHELASIGQTVRLLS